MQVLIQIFLVVFLFFETGQTAEKAEQQQIKISTITHKHIQYISINEFAKAHQLKSTYYDGQFNFTWPDIYFKWND